MKSFISVFTIALFSLLAVLLATGCATILHGSEEGVYFTSEPNRAKLYINGEMKGTTPIQVRLVSKNKYSIEFRKDGYAAKSVLLDNGVGGGWIVFDLVCGVVPIIIDAATGCWYTFDEVAVKAELEPSATAQSEAAATKEMVEPPGRPSREYSHIGTGHWVKNVMDNGKMIVLEDGSIWGIAPSDTAVSAKWPNATPISVGVGKGDYSYQLIDIGANKAVQAKCVGQE